MSVHIWITDHQPNEGGEGLKGRLAICAGEGGGGGGVRNDCFNTLHDDFFLVRPKVPFSYKSQAEPSQSFDQPTKP